MPPLSRRQALAAAASALAAGALRPRLRVEPLSLPDLGGAPDDERYWKEVRGAFDLPDGVTNLDNGWAGSPPRAALDEVTRLTRYLEGLPASRLGEVAENSGRAAAPRLGRLLGVSPDELALVRNATEALDTVILGLPLAPGDEIVCSAHDYWAMLDAIDQRRARDGIVVRMIHPPLGVAAPTDLIRLYQEALSPRTKLVLVTHASNVTGQLYPVKEIAAAAHAVGAEVVVDAAQTLALLPHTIPELDCDYYGASLHKWLLAPVGSGVLWMRPAHISKVWPLFPAGADGGMGRFMAYGTFPWEIAGGIPGALDLHARIGAARKGERLRYLTAYWRRTAAAIPGIRFYTTEAPENSCGIAVFEMKGVDPAKLQASLWTHHKILVQQVLQEVRAPEINAIRVTPNIYTLTSDLDRFVSALQQVAQHGP